MPHFSKRKNNSYNFVNNSNHITIGESQSEAEMKGSHFYGKHRKEINGQSPH